MKFTESLDDKRVRKGMTLTSLVSRPRGGWKYQDAFAVSAHEVRKGKSGKYRWRTVNRSPKFSEPQQRKYKITTDVPHALHNKPVTPKHISMMARKAIDMGVDRKKVGKYVRRVAPMILGKKQEAVDPVQRGRRVKSLWKNYSRQLRRRHPSATVRANKVSKAARTLYSRAQPGESNYPRAVVFKGFDAVAANRKRGKRWYGTAKKHLQDLKQHGARVYGYTKKELPLP